MSTSKNAKRQEEYLRTVYKPDAEGELQHLIDIVLVHGLNPQSKADFANATWTHENGNFWPTKQLPKRIPSARILIFSYNSQVAWDTSEKGVQEHADNLLDRLSGARESRHATVCSHLCNPKEHVLTIKSPKNYTVPIIFIAHSLGGLVVKQALVIAKNNDIYTDLRKATYGLVFFAVPHQGGHGAGLGAIAKNIVLSLTGDAKNDIIESLKSNSLFQENQAAFFKHQLEDYQIVSVYEDMPTKLTKIFGKATALVIVDKKSATLGLPGTREKQLTVRSNHSEVCKFEDDDDRFDPVKRAIGTMADDAIAEQEKTAADRSRNDLPAQEYIQNFLHSLHFPAIESRQEEIAEAHKKTFNWIFDVSGDAVRPRSHFVEWLETGQGTYWVSGKAGSGKSTLMSYICEDARTMKFLKTWAGSRVVEVLTPKFFFWSPGSSMQKTFVGLLRSLLYQIFRKYPEAIPQPARNEPLSAWTEKRLRKILENITRDISSSYRMCFFIDGLDEFSGDQDALITMVQKLVQDANIKVVLSSRPDLIFDRALGSGAMLKLQDLTRGDIEMFVSDRLCTYPRLQSMAAQKPQDRFWPTISSLVDGIVWKSEGVFLWVDLAVKDQIRGINDEDSLEQLKERLRTLPTGIEDLYAHMLNKIDKVHRKEAAWFLQFALLKKLFSLLDFALVNYAQLDYDLESSAEFPSRKVINYCKYTSRRITTTCAGLLEVYAGTTNSDPRGVRVTFLHRTAADFLIEFEQGRDFLVENRSPNRNVFVVWAKVLVAKVRMFGLVQGAPNTVSICIETIMGVTSKAEWETGEAQTAVCDYLELAMKILDQGRRKPLPESHWCTRIRGWASRDSTQCRLKTQKLEDHIFYSHSNESREEAASRLVSEKPIDYLGFAASYGLKLYVQQQMNSLPAKLHSRNAEYLLCCTLGSHDWFEEYVDQFKRTRRFLDLTCTLLNYGANPNLPTVKGTIWGQFLALMFAEYDLGRAENGLKTVERNAWRTVFQCFIEHGADTNGILSVRCSPRILKIEERHLHGLSKISSKLENKLGLWCQYVCRIELSVPRLAWHCLGDSTIYVKNLPVCVLNGASSHLKCTEISIRIKKPDTWELSQNQSDRLLGVHGESVLFFERLAESGRLEFERRILQLYDELSTKGLGHSR